MSRFDHVQYSKTAKHNQAAIKEVCMILEKVIIRTIACERSRDLALMKLEELYMWTGKGIRNDQIARKDVTDE